MNVSEVKLLLTADNTDAINKLNLTDKQLEKVFNDAKKEAVESYQTYNGLISSFDTFNDSIASSIAELTAFDEVEKRIKEDAKNLFPDRFNVNTPKLNDIYNQQRPPAIKPEGVDKGIFYRVDVAEDTTNAVRTKINNMALGVLRDNQRVFSQFGNIVSGAIGVVPGIFNGIFNTAKGIATSAISFIGNAFNGLKTTIQSVGSIFGVIGGALGGFLGLAVNYASQAQDVYAQLSAVEQSSLMRNEGLIDTQEGWINVANGSSKEVQKLTQEHDRLAKQLDRSRFMWEHTTKHSESSAAAMAYLNKEIAENEAALARASGTHRVWQQAHEATGKVSHMSRAEIEAFGMEIERNTKYTKENAIQAIRWGETFTSINKEVMPQAVELAMDLSTAFGRDLRTSVIMVDKALQDPIKGVDNLRRIGVQFSDAQKTQIERLVQSGNLLEAQKIILNELQIELAGSARAAGDTFSGALTIATNAIRRFIMPIGEQLLPNLQAFMLMIANLFEHLNSLDPQLISSIASFAGIASAIGAVSMAIGFLLSPIGLVIGAIAAVKLAIDNNWGGLRETIAGIVTMISPEIDKIRGAIQSVLDAFNFKPENHPEQLEAIKNQMAGYSNAFQQKDSDDPKTSKMGGKTKNPGSIISDKDAGDKLYSDNLKSVLETKAREMIAALGSAINKIATWAASEGKRLFEDAFKSVFGIDFKTVVANVSKGIQDAFDTLKSIWETVIWPAIQPIVNDITTIINNLKDADWGGAFKAIEPLIGAVLKIGGAFLVIAVGGVVKIADMFSKSIRDLVDAVAAAGQGDWGTALSKGLSSISLAVFGMMVISGIGALPGIISSLAAAMWGFIAPLLIAAAPFIAIGAAIAGLIAGMLWLKDNVPLVNDVFNSLGDIVRDSLAAALELVIGLFRVVAQVITNAMIAAKALGASFSNEELTAFDNMWKFLEQTGGTGYEEKKEYYQKVPKKSNGGQSGGNSGNGGGGGAGFSVANPMGSMNPVQNMKSSNTNNNNSQTIIIQKVIVNKPDDYSDIYEETLKEASRRNAPISNGVFTYA